ncbi:DUF2459 domain-containing protein [Novosphingobium sp. RD2P27]|uniref:DUF2459 domain-containing protein n=1 Tax=Novosphingobium kalidii TaxID=3230299 RepID=A0ABV2CYJ4_9SPHN
MAAAPVARLIRWLRLIGAALGLVLASYLLATWIGSSVPRNAAWREPASADYVVGVETNGVHTALVLPVVTPIKDWREDFPSSDLVEPNRPYTHVSISWGEREVFLNTPTWWDLSASAILRILTGGGKGLAHVVYYMRPAASEDLRPVRLSAAQYAALVASIESSFSGGTLQRHPGYGTSDLFYEVGGRYTAVNTCNQWTSNRLAAAGVRVGWWTPSAGGVMKWVPRPTSETALLRDSGPLAQ